MMQAPKTALPWAAGALVLGLAIAAAALGGLPSGATEEPESSTAVLETDTAQSAATPADAGLRVFVDPRRGDLTETPSLEQLERRNATTPSRNRSSRGLVAQHKPDGTVLVDLEGRFMSTIVVHVDEHGNVEAECTHEHDFPTPAELEDPS